MKLWKLAKNKKNHFYKFSLIKHLLLIENNINIPIKNLDYKKTQSINEETKQYFSSHFDYKIKENSEKLNEEIKIKKTINPNKILRMKEIYKEKIEKKKISEIVKKRLFEDDIKSLNHSSKLNEDIIKAEAIEREKQQDLKIVEIKEILNELIDNFDITQFRQVIHEIYSQKLNYF